MTAQPTPPELDAHRHRKDWRDIAERWPDQAWSSEAVLALLDALTRAEARADIRGRAVVMYRERAREAEERIEAVRDVHTGTVWPGVADKPICDACDQMWPCATIRALEG